MSLCRSGHSDPAFHHRIVLDVEWNPDANVAFKYGLTAGCAPPEDWNWNGILRDAGIPEAFGTVVASWECPLEDFGKPAEEITWQS